MSTGTDNFLFLNRGKKWLGWHLHGLELSDGTLRLATLPRLAGDSPLALRMIAAPAAPAGLAALPLGSVLWTEPASHRLSKRDGCDHNESPVFCVGGEGNLGTQFREPRAVLYHRSRRAVFVADTGNHRLQVFDPDTWQLLAIWGQLDADTDLGPGAKPGQFNRPWALAADAEGNIYVAEEGSPRIQKLDLRGQVDVAFEETVQRQLPALIRPVAVTVRANGATTEVYVLDAAAGAVVAYDTQGVQQRRFVVGERMQLLGLAVAEDAIYVGDNKHRRILKFSIDGHYIGVALYDGPVAALAIDERGQLLCLSGEPFSPFCLLPRGGCVDKGFLWGGPFHNISGRPEQWHQVEALLEPMPPEAHFQLFVRCGGKDPPASVGGKPPWSTGSCDLVDVAAAPSDQTFKGKWVRVSRDASQCIVPGAPFEKIWVGAEFVGKGLSSPALSQMRLEFDHPTYLRYLPPVYQDDPQSRKFLARYLSLFESLFADVEDRIADLARLFDPAAAPVDGLDWLAGLLALNLTADWDTPRKRKAIAEAFARYANRGTAAGLRQTLQAELGVVAHIDEPILQTSSWTLPTNGSVATGSGSNSVLGFTTMLASVEPQGAVVGTTAVLDQSQLTAQDDYGIAQFRDVAHRFSIWLYRGQGDDEATVAAVRSVLDREKPAHTVYDLGVIQPRFRVGYQARIGIDAVIAGPPSADTATGLRLGGFEPGRVGQESRVGQTTRLGDTSAESEYLSARSYS